MHTTLDNGGGTIRAHVVLFIYHREKKKKCMTPPGWLRREREREISICDYVRNALAARFRRSLCVSRGGLYDIALLAGCVCGCWFISNLCTSRRSNLMGDSAIHTRVVIHIYNA